MVDTMAAVLIVRLELFLMAITSSPVRSARRAHGVVPPPQLAHFAFQAHTRMKAPYLAHFAEQALSPQNQTARVACPVLPAHGQAPPCFPAPQAVQFALLVPIHLKAHLSARLAQLVHLAQVLDLQLLLAQASALRLHSVNLARHSQTLLPVVLAIRELCRLLSDCRYGQLPTLKTQFRLISWWRHRHFVRKCYPPLLAALLLQSSDQMESYDMLLALLQG